MDEGKDGVGAAGEGGEPESPEETADRLEHEADVLRENLGGLVHELDHRRQGVRWRLVKPLAIVGVVGLVVAGGYAWWRARRLRRRLSGGRRGTLGRRLTGGAA